LQLSQPVRDIAPASQTNPKGEFDGNRKSAAGPTGAKRSTGTTGIISFSSFTFDVALHRE